MQQTSPHWLQFLLFIIPALSAIFAATGLFLTFSQSRRTNTQARAKLVADCLQGFSTDKDIQSAYYEIEYGKFKYDSEFHGSEWERPIDKLLRHFANLALSWKGGLLTTEDTIPVKYYVLNVMRNPEILKYLNFMHKWSDQIKVGKHPYFVLEELSNELLKA